VRSGFLNQLITIAVFLDIAAFDNIDPFILLEDLKEIGNSAHFRKFVENLISVRYLNFVIDGELHDPYNTYKNTPQGFILSSLLFDIYFRNLDQ